MRKINLNTFFRRVKLNQPEKVVADYYGFDAVVELATEYIIKQLSIKSCIKLWQFADNYNMLKLEEVAFDYILQNFAQVYQRNHDFMDLDEIRFNRIIIT